MQKVPKLLIVVFIFALILRIYKLNTFPMGFHVDEVKVGWEALSILKTGRDDHGVLFPLYYNSFGDFRPTGIFYTAIPFLILFGRTIFAVRFLSSFLGAATIFPLYFISLAITNNKKTSLVSAIILSILPWSIATSRATSEVVISVFLILSSLSLFLLRPKISLTLLALSFLFYHSARVVGPVLMVVWIIYFWGKIEAKSMKVILIGFLLTCLFSAVLIFSPTGLARYNQVKIPKQNIRSILINYLSYYDPNFLVGDIAKPTRYMTRNVGIVSLPVFILFLTGIYIIFRTNKNKILFLFMAIGPIPATLTIEDSPNLHRSLFMMPFFVIIAAIGFYYLFEKRKIFVKIFSVLVFASFISFLLHYFNLNENLAYNFRNPRTKLLADYLAQVKNNYDGIYVTNDPDSPYAWFYFFNNYQPNKVNYALSNQKDGKWQFENIIWENNKCPAGEVFGEVKKDKTLRSILVVDNGECFTDYKETSEGAKKIKEFDYNGKVDYRVWEYKLTVR